MLLINDELNQWEHPDSDLIDSLVSKRLLAKKNSLRDCLTLHLTSFMIEFVSKKEWLA